MGGLLRWRRRELSDFPNSRGGGAGTIGVTLALASHMFSIGSYFSVCLLLFTDNHNDTLVTMCELCVGRVSVCEPTAGF